MKRLSFLAALFGGGAAAQKTIVDGTYALCLKPAYDRCPVVNGECPVCGKMAEPWSRPVHRKGEMMPTQCGPLGQCITAIFYYQEDTPYGPTERITRCRTCNAAFWQDEEGQR